MVERPRRLTVLGVPNPEREMEHKHQQCREKPQQIQADNLTLANHRGLNLAQVAGRNLGVHNLKRRSVARLNEFAVCRIGEAWIGNAAVGVEAKRLPGREVDVGG